MTLDPQLTGNAGGVRQQFADPGARGSVARETKPRGGDREGLLTAGHAGEPLRAADRSGKFLSVPPG